MDKHQRHLLRISVHKCSACAAKFAKNGQFDSRNFIDAVSPVTSNTFSKIVHLWQQFFFSAFTMRAFMPALLLASALAVLPFCDLQFCEKGALSLSSPVCPCAAATSPLPLSRRLAQAPHQCHRALFLAQPLLLRADGVQGAAVRGQGRDRAGAGEDIRCRVQR